MLQVENIFYHLTKYTIWGNIIWRLCAIDLTMWPIDLTILASKEKCIGLAIISALGCEEDECESNS